MTTEIDENKINIDYSLFSWDDYEEFMTQVQYVLMNPFWCVSNQHINMMCEIIDHDNDKLLEHSLKSFDEKYTEIQQIHLHNFYLQQVDTFFNIFSLYNNHHFNYQNNIKELTKKYGRYDDQIEKYIIVTNVEEYKLFVKEKQKLDNTLALTEYDKINPNLYLQEINIILFKTERTKYNSYLSIIDQNADNAPPKYKRKPLLMYKLISDIFDIKKIQNLKINYELINKHFTNY